MTINFPAGLAAIIGGLLVFLGSSYLVLALNLGWRFGYWVWGACLGGLMTFLSVFWVLTALGPRGEEALWIPIAADAEEIGAVAWGDATLSSPGRYPAGGWQRPAEDSGLAREVDPLESALSSCFAFDEDRLEAAQEQIADLKSPERTFLEWRIGRATRVERESEVCSRVYSFIPTAQDLPRAGGDPVAVINDVTDVRFNEEEGLLLAQAVIIPNTYDARVTGDEEGLEPMRVGEPFLVLAYKDPGSLRTPAVMYLVLSVLWSALHLWRLNYAERRQLSPVI